MKTYRYFFIITFLVLGIASYFVYRAIAEIRFSNGTDPTIVSTSDGRTWQNVMTKYTDQEGNIEWSTDDRTINVILEGWVEGLGFAKATFSSVRIANDNRSVWDGESEKIGSFNEKDGTNPKYSTSDGKRVRL